MKPFLLGLLIALGAVTVSAQGLVVFNNRVVGLQSFNIAVVPEPSPWALTALGLGVVVVWRWLRFASRG